MKNIVVVMGVSFFVFDLSGIEDSGYVIFDILW